ncbi:unnamed protein product [Amoebophrya sp. A25]|nr:unnamed protein product [Amoebophrya sp. A25]|eukprot:GSA25T00009670001.1
MQSAVGQALQASGLQNKLKSELRYQLIDNLRKQGKIQLDGFIPVSKQRHDLREKALFSLILETLKQKGKLYSMSVLTPECGLRDGEILDAHDICKVLGVNYADVIGADGALGSSDSSQTILLDALLQWVEKQQKANTTREMHKRDSTCQTDDADSYFGNVRRKGSNAKLGDTLEWKLQKLDAELMGTEKENNNLFNGTMGSTGALANTNYRNNAKYLEEKMLLYQQQCERRYRQEMEAELGRIRALERQQIRLEEAQRARGEWQTRQLEANKVLTEKEDSLRTKEEKALTRLKAKEADIERQGQEQRGLLLRKMEEQNLMVQRKTEWVALEEKRLALVRENMVKDREKFAEERRIWEASKHQLEDQAEAKLTKHKADVEKALHDDWSKARDFQLAVEKEKCGLELLKQERSKALDEERKTFEKNTQLRKQIVELEDRVKEFKILYDSAQKQIAISAEQAKVEQKQAEKLAAVNDMREAEIHRQEEAAVALRAKEALLIKQQEENLKLLQGQVEESRKETATKHSELERAVASRSRSDKEAEDQRSEVLKLREDNIRLKVEVERLQRANEDGLLKEREMRKMEQIILAQYQQGSISPNNRSVDGSPVVDAEKLFTKWEQDIDRDLATTSSRRIAPGSSSGFLGSSSSRGAAGNSHADTVLGAAALERKTRQLNQEIADFARNGFFKTGNMSLSRSSGPLDVEAILKEAGGGGAHASSDEEDVIIVGGGARATAEALANGAKKDNSQEEDRIETIKSSTAIFAPMKISGGIDVDRDNHDFSGNDKPMPKPAGTSSTTIKYVEQTRDAFTTGFVSSPPMSSREIRDQFQASPVQIRTGSGPGSGLYNAKNKTAGGEVDGGEMVLRSVTDFAAAPRGGQPGAVSSMMTASSSEAEPLGLQPPSPPKPSQTVSVGGGVIASTSSFGVEKMVLHLEGRSGGAAGSSGSGFRQDKTPDEEVPVGVGTQAAVTSSALETGGIPDDAKSEGTKSEMSLHLDHFFASSSTGGGAKMEKDKVEQQEDVFTVTSSSFAPPAGAAPAVGAGSATAFSSSPFTEQQEATKASVLPPIVPGKTTTATIVPASFREETQTPASDAPAMATQLDSVYQGLLSRRNAEKAADVEEDDIIEEEIEEEIFSQGESFKSEDF